MDFDSDGRDKDGKHLDVLDATLEKVSKGELKRVIVTMPPRHGKLIEHGEVVPTPNGWVRHGDLKIGDKVYHPSGKIISVIALSEEGMASLKVNMTDGASIVVHPNHEWTLYDRSRAEWRTVETRYLATQTLVGGKKNRSRFQLPYQDQLEGYKTELPMDPYTLGAWLGDGSTTKGAITHAKEDELTIPYEISSQHVHNETGVVTTYYKNMWADLKKIGVAGNKHIPDVYLWADADSRWSLLQGLIDTDGSIGEDNRVRFINTNSELVGQVVTLVRSLGYRASSFVTEPCISSSGIGGTKPVYVVSYSPHDGRIPARLKRKSTKSSGNSVRRRIGIVSIEPVEPRLGRCIQVDSEDGLYLVGEHMTPTHNSERVSKKFPAWHVGRNPGDEIILASYSVDLSRGFSRIARDTLTANHSVFDVKVDPNNQSAESWGTEGHRGGVTAAGVGGPITGKGARIAIIDDPVKNAEEANSEVMREKVWDWYTSTLYTRLTPDGRIIVVMTRWHEDDLVGRLLKKEADEIREGTHKGEKWTVINFPALAEDDDFLGRKHSEPLWPEFGFDSARLEQIKSDVGSYVFNALYQQRPSAAGGTIFKRIHFRYFREEMIGNANYFVFRGKDGEEEKKFLKRDCEMVFQTVDTANSEKTINDYFVVSTFYVTPQNDILLYDVYRTHITGPDQKPLMREQNSRYRPRFQAIEDKTFGTNLIQECKREGMTIRPIKVDKDKVTRSLPIAARYEVGKVYHREGTHWLTDLEDELLSFPRGKHDDQVDTLSIAGELVHSFVSDNTPWTANGEDVTKTHFDMDYDEEDFQTTEMGFGDW